LSSFEAVQREITVPDRVERAFGQQESISDPERRCRKESMGAQPREHNESATPPERDAGANYSSQRRTFDQQRREAEERLKRASAASEEAARRARSIADEVKESTKAVEDAKLAVAKATKELESLFREPPATE